MNSAYLVGADFYDYVDACRTRPDVGFFVDLARSPPGIFSNR
jgi:hypothetical protein